MEPETLAVAQLRFVKISLDILASRAEKFKE
jgi:hypothetical protein